MPLSYDGASALLGRVTWVLLAAAFWPSDHTSRGVQVLALTSKPPPATCDRVMVFAVTHSTCDVRTSATLHCWFCCLPAAVGCCRPRCRLQQHSAQTRRRHVGDGHALPQRSQTSWRFAGSCCPCWQVGCLSRCLWSQCPEWYHRLAAAACHFPAAAGTAVRSHDTVACQGGGRSPWSHAIP